MLKLFQSIFGGNQARGNYPESLIEMATERVVDGTYPRLRAVPGYKKTLRAPVIHAIDHVVAVVDGLSEIIPTNKISYSNTPVLSAVFVSPDHLREVFGNDPDLSEFREANAACKEGVTALLLAECHEKNTLGVALEGEMLRRDVAQVTVSFSKHRLLAPATSELESKRLLKRRAFDHMISLALMKICESKAERAQLIHHRELLRSKLGVLQKSGWGFDSQLEAQGDHSKLQSELDEIEKQLGELSVDDRALVGQLEIVTDVLVNAGKHLWMEQKSLHLDRMNIKRDPENPDARLIQLNELHNSRGQKLAALFISLNIDELPQREAFGTNLNKILAELG